LSHPLTSRAVAVRQLQITMPLSKLAQDVLQRSKDASFVSDGVKTDETWRFENH
jgi:hypothetical protein